MCMFCSHQIREELRANGIDVYPQKEFDEDAEDRMINEKIRVRAYGYSPKANNTIKHLKPFSSIKTKIYFTRILCFRPVQSNTKM